jgi:hypothetical protein
MLLASGQLKISVGGGLAKTSNLPAGLDCMRII